VADREVPVQRAKVVLLEHLRDEPKRTLGDDVATVLRRGDAGGLLPAVLQGEQREVREASDVVLGPVDPEHPALVAWTVALVEGRLWCRHGEPPADGRRG
jgi:hypothetical protein